MSWPPTELRRPGGGWSLDEADLARVNGSGPALDFLLEQLVRHDAEALQLSALELPTLIRRDARQHLGETPLSAESILKLVLLSVSLPDREVLMNRGMLDVALPACRLRARVGPRGIQVRLDRQVAPMAPPPLPEPELVATREPSGPEPPRRGPAPLSFEGLDLADMPVVTASDGLFIPVIESTPRQDLRPSPALMPPRPPELIHPGGGWAVDDASLRRLPDSGFTLAQLLTVARRRAASRLELEGGMAPTAALDGRQVDVGLPVLSHLQVYRLLLEALTLEARHTVLDTGVLDGILPHYDGPWRIFARLDRVGLMVFLEFGR